MGDYRPWRTGQDYWTRSLRDPEYRPRRERDPEPDVRPPAPKPAPDDEEVAAEGVDR